MPWRYSCSEHDTWRGGHHVDAIEHVDELHPGDGVDLLRQLGIITVEFMSQNVARGIPDRHLFMCRRCNERVETIDPERAATPYCDDCLMVTT